MKKHLTLLLLTLCLAGCTAQETPVQFSEVALNDTFITTSGEKVPFKSILKKHPEKIIIIDIWASWCADCIKGMPKVKKLQQQYPDAVYVFLSLDKNEQSWAKGIKKYNVKGEHYFMQSGWKGAFAEFLNIDWIPRYMVIDKEGTIKIFRAVKADDTRVTKFLINNYKAKN